MPAAFVMDSNGYVSLRRLTTGIRRDGFVEVLAGLVPGQSVVTSGAGLLTDGDRVQAVSPLVVAEHSPKTGPP
jgi:hypothetical protein